MAARKTGKPGASKSLEGNPTRRRADWEAIERDYRTGKYTLRELEAKHGVFNSSIARKAKECEWSKDLSAAIRQATNAKLDSALVSTIANQNAQDVSITIAAAAAASADVILGHRKGLQRIAAIKSKMLDQIEQAAQNMPDLTAVIEMVRSPDDKGIDRANDALKKAMGRSALVDDLKKLADVDEKVRSGERIAYKLDDDGVGKGSAPSASLSDTERAVRLAAMLAKVQDR